MEFLSSAELWKVLFSVIGAFLLFVSCWVITQALWPKFIRQAQDTYARPFLNFFFGLIVLAITTAVSAVFAPVGGAQLVGGVLLALVLVLALGGSAGLARRIGSGMGHPSDKEQPWRRTMRGGVTLGMTMLIPILNLPPLAFILVSGIGASVRTLWKARTDKKAAASSYGSDDES